MPPKTKNQLVVALGSFRRMPLWSFMPKPLNPWGHSTNWKISAPPSERIITDYHEIPLPLHWRKSLGQYQLPLTLATERLSHRFEQIKKCNGLLFRIRLITNWMDGKLIRNDNHLQYSSQRKTNIASVRVIYNSRMPRYSDQRSCRGSSSNRRGMQRINLFISRILCLFE